MKVCAGTETLTETDEQSWGLRALLLLCDSKLFFSASALFFTQGLLELNVPLTSQYSIHTEAYHYMHI